jgi:hypothetical protein
LGISRRYTSNETSAPAKQGSPHQPNYASNKPKSFNITRIYMFAILSKEKPDIENIRDLNLAVVRHMIV